MTTTKKQLVNIAFGLTKEIAKSPNQGLGIEYKNNAVTVWFYGENKAKPIMFYTLEKIRENKKKFALAVRLIRNKNLAHKFILGN